MIANHSLSQLSYTPVKKKPAARRALEIGGAKEDRTPDLLNAIQALSQLSYNPKDQSEYMKTNQTCQ